uniref:Solute carrier family 22 member 23 n=1 Tax=Astyanax mexicanus TaxID=7994 RepID=A0A3B1IZK0_ASTMX
MTVAFSVDVTMFSTLRFFEGFFLAGITLSLYVLRIELCLPGWRFSMTMVANFVMLAGQLLMPGLAALCRNWQILQAVIICPLLLMLTYIWLFPESLRWLLATQQYCRAKWIVERIAKTNKANLDSDELLSELHKAQPKKPKKTCIVKMVGTRNLWKNIVVLCVNSLTGYGIHYCFARSMMDTDTEEVTMFHNFYADYYTMAGIAVASCMALCPAVGLMGRRGGLLMFMIITALASLLQLGLLNLLGKYSVQLNIERSDTLKSNFSVAFSIIGMFSSHAVSNLSIFFCAEITPTVIRGGGLGLVLASAGFGRLTAPIMELHNQKGYFLHHVIFACCTLICIICILLLPETRYQPLPETLADGESYTRQPLLPPRKPAEQRHLLPHAQSREYAQVTDTPLHAAAATAVSTMESTASSAIDLTIPPDGEPDSMPLSLMKLHKETQPADGTLLTVVPHTSTPLSASPAHPSTNESLPDLIANVPPQDSAAASETPPSLLSVHTLSHTPPSPVSPLTADTSETASPSTPESPSHPAHPAETTSPPLPTGHSPAQTPEITPYILHTTGTPPPPRISPALSTDSRSQPETDSIVNRAVKDFPPPDVSQTDSHHLSDSVDVPAGGAVDFCGAELPAPLPPPTVDPAAIALNNIALPPPSDSPVYLVNDLDSLHSAPSSLHVQPVPPPSSSSPIDSDALLLTPSILDPTLLETLSPSSEGAAILSEAPTVPSAGDPVTLDLTVSSPIDSGLSPAAVFPASSSSSSTANEVASS